MIRLYKFIKDNLTDAQHLVLRSAIADIIQMISSQGQKTSMPDFSKFATGNISQGHLSGQQKYGRIFVLYMALLKSSGYNSFKEKRKERNPRQIKKKKRKKVVEKLSKIALSKNITTNVDVESGTANDDDKPLEVHPDSEEESVNEEENCNGVGDTNSIDSDDPKNVPEIVVIAVAKRTHPSHNFFDLDKYQAIVSLLEQMVLYAHTFALLVWIEHLGRLLLLLMASCMPSTMTYTKTRAPLLKSITTTSTLSPTRCWYPLFQTS